MIYFSVLFAPCSMLPQNHSATCQNRFSASGSFWELGRPTESTWETQGKFWETHGKSWETKGKFTFHRSSKFSVGLWEALQRLRQSLQPLVTLPSIIKRKFHFFERIQLPPGRFEPAIVRFQDRRSTTELSWLGLKMIVISIIIYFTMTGM